MAEVSSIDTEGMAADSDEVGCTGVAPTSST